MENLTVSINLQETIYVSSGTTPIASYSRHSKLFFLKEGWTMEIFMKEYPYFDHYVKDIHMIGHFSLQAWSFAADASIALSDFPTINV